MFAFIGLIACICAFAFSKLTKYYKQDNNGGSYIFARGAFGRFIGFITAFLVYIILPLVLANQILMLIKANFDPAMSGGIHPDGSYA
jgi:amino acid transporter